jgi:hypothetical protein
LSELADDRWLLHLRPDAVYVADSRRSLLDAKHADEHEMVWERRWPELGDLTGSGRLEMRLRRRAPVRGWQAVLKMGVVVRTCTTTVPLDSHLRPCG